MLFHPSCGFLTMPDSASLPFQRSNGLVPSLPAFEAPLADQLLRREVGGVRLPRPLGPQDSQRQPESIDSSLALLLLGRVQRASPQPHPEPHQTHPFSRLRKLLLHREAAAAAESTLPHFRQGLSRPLPRRHSPHIRGREEADGMADEIVGRMKEWLK